MRTNNDFMRQRLLQRAGIAEPPKPKWTLEKLEKQWSDDFEQLMKNRLMMGALRYGGMQKPCNGAEFNTDQIVARVSRYIKTGNAEHLVDVANFALVEFVQKLHPNYHFKAIDR